MYYSHLNPLNTINYRFISDSEEENQQVYNVTIQRENILEELLQIYDNKSIVNDQLNVKFKGEAALDFGGVTMDLISTFWDAAFSAYFEGDTIKIPFVPPLKHQERKGVFPKLGRILYHGWRLTKQIPVRFCEPCFMEKKLLMTKFLKEVSCST